MQKAQIEEFITRCRNQWLFEEERVWILYALKHYPEWNTDAFYARLEWFERPVFHADLEKSRVQPKRPLHLSRDLRYIPKKETLDSLCFVRATGSNKPYFELVVQLMESLQATRWYSHIPIKVLDCGLSKSDADYLKQRFHAEVKDPGWDVDVSLINEQGRWELSGYKGIMARPYLHKHFSGYDYYCFIDADIWIQDENVLDRYVHLCEQQEVALSRGPEKLLFWHDKCTFHGIIPEDERSLMFGKKTICGGMFCLHKNFMMLYQQEFERLIQKTKFFRYSSDDIILNFVFHKYGKEVIFDDNSLHSIDFASKPDLMVANTDGRITIRDKIIGAVHLLGHLKHLPYDHNIQHNVQLPKCSVFYRTYV